ncbi:CmcJ/NvfI family oxidoreductase [Terricaulis sp.]|uniref:CmcJ/NvfI family oxidoreductase n=1 Tax=Terricaulis sp. TaxID=2768686 RepID=UPI003783B33E
MPLELLEPPSLTATSVEASLQYLEPSPDRPVVSFANEGRGETNAVFSPRRVRVLDARGLGATMNVQGFELIRHASSVADFEDDDWVKIVGYGEAEQIVQAATGARRVHVFDATRRKRSPDSPRQPSVRVHNDYTPASARQRVRDLLGERAKQLLQRRIAFINVWRPVNHPAVDWPLALADARSVDAADLVPTEIVYPGRVGEIYSLTYSPRHAWRYYPALALNEAILIKCYDARENVARWSPHTAFDNPLAPPGVPPRESIEFRTIAFF